MDRRALIADAGEAIVTGDAAAAAAVLAAEDGAIADAMRGFAAYWNADYAACGWFAARAREAAVDAQEHALAAAVTLWARAGGAIDAETAAADRILQTVARLSGDEAVSVIARGFATDGALMVGRLDLAQQIAPSPADAELWRGNALEAPLRGIAVRVALFAGRIDDARDLLPQLREAGERLRLPLWTLACEAMAAGTAGDAGGVRAAVDGLLALGLDGTTFTGRGALMLAAYGTSALGDTRTAAELARRAGEYGDLSLLAVADRAMAVDLLIADAIARTDEAALARVELLLPGFDATAEVTLPTLLRARARLLLHRGDAAAAAAHADAAAELSAAAHRRLERGDSRLVAARALLDTDLPAAARMLREEVRTADAAGERALRERAARVLAAAHRRLPPPADAADALSAREREVLDRLRSGEDEEDIAEHLHVERSTVHRHLTRAMAAYGVSGRVALMHAVGVVGVRRPLPALTERQSAVTELMSTGLTNGAIAEALGVSTKAVEAHLAQAMLRCEVPTRLALAHRWLTRA